MSIEVQSFDFSNVTEPEIAAYNICRNQIFAERLPDDPPISLAETLQRMRNIPDFVKVTPWVAWNAAQTEIVGFGHAQYSLESNLHMLQFQINVLPAYRRIGLGKQFLSRIAKLAQQMQRETMLSSTTDRVPAGAAFMRCIGAEPGLEAHTNQLALGDLAPGILEQWLEHGRARGNAFAIGVWEDEYPEEHIAEIVQLFGLLNDQPFGELEVEDFNYTAAHIRQIEQSIFARGYRRWTIYAQEKETGKFAGYTEVTWNPKRPGIIDQGMTGVFPQYRNRGLGRWLKAEMLAKLLDERPAAKFVRTQNADANAPMMKINHELGFKPYIAESVWQVQTAQAVTYLNR